MQKLPLHEQIMLLALTDEAGTIAGGTMYRLAIAGAVLAELILEGRLQTVRPRRRELIEPVSVEPTNDPLLDECLIRVGASKRRQGAETWVSRFSGIPKLKERVAMSLVGKGILRLEQSKVLLIFTQRVYPAIDAVPEADLIERLNRAIFEDASDVDPRTAVIVALASATNMLSTIFPRKALKRRKRRIEEIGSNVAAGQATKDAVAAVQVAITTAAIIPAVTSS